jgi:NADPH-dependent curcumin reductase CurA
MTSGQVILVTAAAGGTGQFAVQVSFLIAVLNYICLM